MTMMNAHDAWKHADEATKALDTLADKLREAGISQRLYDEYKALAARTRTEMLRSSADYYK